MTAEHKNDHDSIDELGNAICEESRPEREALAMVKELRESPEWQDFRDQATSFVRSMQDAYLATEEHAAFIPKQLLGADKGATLGGFREKRILWSLIFEGERDRRGIPDPNFYFDPDEALELDEDLRLDDELYDYVDPEEGIVL